MFRKKKDSNDYEIDRKLTGQLLVQSNAELQEELLALKGKYRRLEKDYKNLQVEHSRVLFDMEAIAQKVVEAKWNNVKKAFKKVLDDLVINND